MRTRLIAALALFAAPTCAAAQSAPAPAAAPSAAADPLTSHTRNLHFGMRVLLLRAAEVMPEESYGFSPVEGVRTFAQLVGHVADSQYLFCSAAAGEAPPQHRIERTRTGKAELIAALRDAFAYCDGAYTTLTDANAAEMRTFHGGPLARMNVLGANEVHTTLHYGNMVTYLRMNGITPPSSDAEFLQQVRSGQQRPR